MKKRQNAIQSGYLGSSAPLYVPLRNAHKTGKIKKKPLIIYKRWILDYPDLGAGHSLHVASTIALCPGLYNNIRNEDRKESSFFEWQKGDCLQL
jgi:hypothetical protein